jgi:hypothetical protein
MKEFKFTKEERNQIYTGALLDYDKISLSGLCSRLYDQILKLENRNDTQYPGSEIDSFMNNIDQLFPEFWDQRPLDIKDRYDFWWDMHDHDSRIECLEKCINLTK